MLRRSVALIPTGQISFTPDANFDGLASFGYTISDGQGGIANVIDHVRVFPVDDARWQ